MTDLDPTQSNAEETQASEKPAGDEQNPAPVADSGDKAEASSGKTDSTDAATDSRKGDGRGKDRGGKKGGKGQDRKGQDRKGQSSDEDDGGLFDEVIKVYRCATVVKGGRRFSFSALVIVGDRQSKVGIGYGKAKEVPAAVDKAKKEATRTMIETKHVKGTLPHRVTGRFGASKVVMIPASPGTGVIAGASVRPLLELAGYHDVLTKSYGSNSPKNLVRAAYKGLQQLMLREDIERLRGVKIAG